MSLETTYKYYYTWDHEKKKTLSPFAKRLKLLAISPLFLEVHRVKRLILAKINKT